jgi:hypothetical protein
MRHNDATQRCDGDVTLRRDFALSRHNRQRWLSVSFSNLLNIAELEFSTSGVWDMPAFVEKVSVTIETRAILDRMCCCALSPLLVDFLQSVRLLGLVECFGLWSTLSPRLWESENFVIFIKMRHFSDFETCSHILWVQFFPPKNTILTVRFGGFSRY